jgi:hypothetical protein
MTIDDTGWGDPPDPEVAQHGEQPQDGLPGQPRIDEVEPAADGLLIQDPLAASRTFLITTACVVGGLVSAGLVATEMAEYAHHNRLAVSGLHALADLPPPCLLVGLPGNPQ